MLFRSLLYEQGFTIQGARNRLQELAQHEREQRRSGAATLAPAELAHEDDAMEPHDSEAGALNDWAAVRAELLAIRRLLEPSA